ncbi:MAG: hypothetical protein ACRC2T_05495 [Thermoguttaceae bacterium]
MFNRCNHCGEQILFGACKHDGLFFCRPKCKNAFFEARDGIIPPDDLVNAHANAIHKSDCPICGALGPVDVHTSHKVMSFLLVTQFSSPSNIYCRGCGNKDKIKNMFISGLLGWWGFPFGIILTPIYIGRNFMELFFPFSPEEPSQYLKQLIKYYGVRSADMLEHEKGDNEPLP